MNYLSVEDLKQINLRVIEATGGANGAVNEANLFHVCKRVESFGKTVTDKAAFYLFHLAFTAHAFTDGNKRTALAACNAFLQENGFTFNSSDEELVGVALLVASGKMPVDEVIIWLETKTKKMSKP